MSRKMFILFQVKLKKIENKNYEIVFVNDFSDDNTISELSKLSKLNSKIIYFDNKKKDLVELLILVLTNLVVNTYVL